ncbi:glycosyltransferase family 4 protein [Nocardioides marmoribigeumensis]|uniref:Phosphatidylinositol alpha-mannosyltransferase n=1 Tax=Nocardioides marmoribigeumensis TaxID=433649 RepID=A0ABU2BUK6_9ACTN|nr:glycosyltransferase family 4 protein [Nocardioides marmoribigeumensis]MDR7361039.1 phosphatidylinositol alpha-mannosyltransferase [Nocardioides marmoribigeumensis]
MRVGLVCPYSLDARGGVQAQVLGLAGSLRRLGHHVGVLAPGRPNTGQHPEWVTTTGQDLPVRWNGSVARLDLGPQTARRTRAWLGDGRFDVLHLHEPVTPSVTWHALGAGSLPLVATVHTAQERALAMRAGAATVARRSRRIDAHIAVSRVAADTLARYSDAPVEVIPNALDLERFAGERSPSATPTVLFLGRADEPRKGLAVALRAMSAVVPAHPTARLVVAGPGHVEGAADHVDVIGPVSEAEKARLLLSADVVLAPHLGGESFGIVVAEAMAAGAPVVASDLPAFRALLGDGRHGLLVPPGRSADLAAAVTGLLADPARRTSLGRSGRAAARRLDWSVVTPRIVEVYRRTLSPR